MDINETLRNVRELATAVLDAGDPRDAAELASAVDDLDGWLSAGGFLPEAWNAIRHTTPDNEPQTVDSASPGNTQTWQAFRRSQLTRQRQAKDDGRSVKEALVDIESLYQSIPCDENGNPLAWRHHDGSWTDAWNGIYATFADLTSEMWNWTASESDRVLAYGESPITQDDADERRDRSQLLRRWQEG